jgi:adenylate cyclase
MRRSKGFRIALLTLISFAVVLVLHFSGLLSLFELKAYDGFSRMLNPAEGTDRIVMVEIDQPSLDALSAQGINWPWPRQMYAPIIEYLSEAEAVFIDILYTEASSYGQEDDMILAESVKTVSNVYLPIFLTNQDKVMSAEDEEFVERIAIQEYIEPVVTYGSAITPIDPLKEGVRGAGNVTIAPDQDGVYRRVPLVFGLNGLRIPHFVLGHFMERGGVRVRKDRLVLGDEPIPLKKGRLMLRFYTDQNPFARFSAAEILDFYLKEMGSIEPAVPRSYFRGKYVFIGLTAPGLYDLKPTAVSSISTGVLVHATTLENILNETYITPVGSAALLVFVFLICLVVSLIVLSSHSIYVNSSLFVVLLVVAVAIPAILFKLNYYMNITPPSVSLVLSFTIAATYSYATEGKHRKQLRNAFQHYVAPAVVDTILKEAEKLKLGGEKKAMTALFSDIRGFTTISESMDPTDLVRFLNEYFSIMTRVIMKYEGTLDKFIGDAIMAFYGAPLEQRDHAVRGCRTAVEMLRALREVQPGWEARHFPSIDIGIGLNSGEMTVGNMGSDERFDYTIMGDNVNLASRLEGINKQYGTNIVISQYTRGLIGDQDFFVRELDSVRVKGKKEPVTIYELVDDHTPEPARVEMLESLAEGLHAYKARRWREAAVSFTQALRIDPADFPSKLYVSRCEEYVRQPPPEDWDGVFVMETK